MMKIGSLLGKANPYIRAVAVAIAVLALNAGCGETPNPRAGPPKTSVTPTPAAPSFDVEGEAARLRAALHREVPNLIVDTPESEKDWLVRAHYAVAASHLEISRAQLLVVVDRNPAVQQLRVVLARPEANWESLGGTKVSTGQTGRFDYYVTPTGVFLHTDAILDWRAEGTYNAQHIRGLGVKGMRVWDFGWQPAEKGWGIGETGEIRLLLHATDPAYLERRLGQAASKGCVRTPAAMNRFLDRHGVLDADYERAAKDDPRFAALLLPDRTPTPLAGDALVIVDSSEPLPVAGQRSPAANREQRSLAALGLTGVPQLGRFARSAGCS